VISSIPTELIATAEPRAVLQWAYENFDRIAIVSSLQAESSVIIEMASQIDHNVRVLTLDTGRLPQETHDMIDRVRDRYGIEIEVITPDPDEVRQLVGAHGTNLFYGSVELRRLCCDVRKSRPLDRALRGYDAWVTGVRRKQSVTRAQTEIVAVDHEHNGIAKIAPLAGWSKTEVWAYIREHELPYHALYDQGYTSIGCAPCTRATSQGEDERAGRWWWEKNEVKECGIHFPSGGEGGPARLRARPYGARGT
jgi:phosphoadenosine phosphosulfate reductase